MIKIEDKLCPVCGDEMSEVNDNFRATWSDYFDNIVCRDCSEKVWQQLEDGTLTHCNTIAIWKDCNDHDDCYYAECAVCNYKSETDCKE